MKYYNCKVRLNGNVQNEVFKAGVTTPELMILRKIHSPEAVLDITAGEAPVKALPSYATPAEKEEFKDRQEEDDGEFDDLAERHRLAELYGAGLGFDGSENETPMTPIEKLFGGEFVALPQRLPEEEKAERQAKKAAEKAAAMPKGKREMDDERLRKIS